VIYLKRGREVASGDPAEVVTRYEEDMAEERPATLAQSVEGAGAVSNTGVRIVQAHLENEDGAHMSELRSGAPARLVVEYEAHQSVDNLVVTLLVREMAEEMQLVLNLNSSREGATFRLKPGAGRLELELPFTVLGPGLYVAKLILGTPSFYVFDAIESFRFLVRTGKGMPQSTLYQPHSWKHVTLDAVTKRVATGGAS
jgi:lipopolysaccharide transport system ATP-binding protein